MPSITTIFDAKNAIDITLKIPSVSDPIKDLIFKGAGQAVNSHVLPARYYTKTLKSIPMVYGSINAEPMEKTLISNINYDIGSFFAKTSFDSVEMAEWEQMTAKDANRELEVVIKTDGMVAKDDYVKNELATAMTGTLAIKTRVNQNGDLDTFNIVYGTLSTTTRVGASWLTATKAVMGRDCKKNHKAIEAQLGSVVLKSDILHFASEEVYTALDAAVESTQSNDTYKVTRGDFQGYEYIAINGYKVFDIKGDYRDAATQAAGQAVAANYIQAVYVGASAGHKLYYLKVKNKKLGFRPLPLGLVPVEYPNGTGFEVNFVSRPIPIFNVSASTKMLCIS